MKWFRRHIRTGSRLALFALVIQIALSFGHFHPIAAAEAAAAVQTEASSVDPADNATADLAIGATDTQPPAGPGNAPHPADNCAICAVTSLACSVLLIATPVLLLPEARELHFTGNAEFVHLTSVPTAFQSRAPPLS